MSVTIRERESGTAAGAGRGRPRPGQVRRQLVLRPDDRPGRFAARHRAYLHLPAQGYLQLGRLRRARRPDRARRGMGLSQGQARPRGDRGRYGFYAGNRNATKEENSESGNP